MKITKCPPTLVNGGFSRVSWISNAITGSKGRQSGIVVGGLTSRRGLGFEEMLMNSKFS